MSHLPYLTIRHYKTQNFPQISESAKIWIICCPNLPTKPGWTGELYRIHGLFDCFNPRLDRSGWHVSLVGIKFPLEDFRKKPLEKVSLVTKISFK